MPIGSETEAAEILAAFQDGEDNGFWGEEIPIPGGWRYLGCGMYRTAFLSPTKVVYKLERGRRSNIQNNRGEYERILEMRYDETVRESVIIPKAWLYEIYGTDVIAMEFMDGEWTEWHDGGTGCEYCGERFGGTCAYLQFERLESKLGMSDIHSGNAVFIPAQKRWALVDLGA
jgi:hypothetical protein